MPYAALAQSASDVQNMSPEDKRAYMEGMSDDERDRTAMRERQNRDDQDAGEKPGS